MSEERAYKLLPVSHARLIEGHEIDLTGGTALGGAEKDLVVPLAQELESLGFFVHEHPV